MSEAQGICSKYGAPIDTKKTLFAPDKADIVLVEDIIAYIEALRTANSTLEDIKKISNQETDGSGNKNSHKGMVEEVRLIYTGYVQSATEATAILKSIGALERTLIHIKTLLDKPDLEVDRRANLVEDQRKLKDMLESYKKLQSALDKADGLVSDPAKKSYAANEKSSPKASQLEKIIDAMARTVNQLGKNLSPKAKTALQITDNFAARAAEAEGFASQAEGYIKVRCKEGPQNIKAEIPKGPVEEEFTPKFKFSLRLAGGYGDRATGDNRYFLSAEERGILMQAAASGYLLLHPKFALQADYNVSVPYDPKKGGDNLVSNNDYGRLTAFWQPLAELDVAAKVGWRYYRNDYPTSYNPDQNTLVEGLRLNWRPIGKLSVNLDQGLTAGWTNAVYPPPQDKGDFHAVTFFAAPGASYTFGPVTPFLGAILGYVNDGAEAEGGIFGGYAGAGLKIGGHTADLRGQYVYDKNATYFDRGLKIMGRYSFGTEEFGIGLATAYAFDTDKRHAVIGNIFSDILLKKDLLWGNGLYLSPFFGAGLEKQEDDKTVNLNGGVMFRFGDTRPAEMAPVRPYSTAPLPEEK